MRNERSSEIHRILKKYWGYDGFRPLQEDIILSVLEGRDTLALLPTGGGKSICFQVPALALGGLCIVVSPLIALMKDQVMHLKERGIKATALYSGMSHDDILGAIQNVIFDPDYRFLYVSPERLQTASFKMNLSKMPVTMIAVDEAHCISQWGYDFRPPYLEIANIRKLFPKAPVLALTATATPEVVVDIQHRLDFITENVFQKSFKRDNLTYFVVKEEDKNGRMLRIMQRYPGTGIVYVRNRRKTAEVAEFLSRNGIPADFYHAGLDTRTRDKKQDDWMKGRIRVIVATNAFGMGIDKPDVRFVVHIDLPDTLEGYFQEAGRGGRDEKAAVAILLYDSYDLRQLKRNWTLSFPPIEKIREAYEQLCQHYRIPMGEGKNTVHPFYLPEHARNSHMDPVQYFNALQFLEKSGVIVLSEHLREHSQIHFKMQDAPLREFEKENPDVAEFVRTILRSYGGVFSQYVDIDERVLAERTQLTEEEVCTQLQGLKERGVITYQPKSEIPLLVFVQDRIPKEQLYFNPKDYADRKQKAEERMRSVENYVLSSDTCRSRLLLRYFGETDSPVCGQCDVCLKRNRKQLAGQNPELADAIKKLSKESKLDKKTIFEKLSSSYDEEEIANVMRWLIDQNEIFLKK
ncbi:MAG: RecQ family ATP-dependent DNA helicase [Bacteroidales bacterium]|nr:RecQ family ATP-dependent DNA helicase [Bacteroidales bacterium]